MTATFEYHRPTTLADALRLGESIPGARFIAGGTDVMVRMREGKVHPSALVSLSRVDELKAIEAGPPLVIGGGVRVADLQTSAEVGRHLPVLVQATRQLGSAQIRAVATVGGNLCNASPCADLAPPLLVHEARVRLESAGGVRELPLEDFFVGPRASILEPGEILRAIVVDRAPAGARAVFLKKGRVQMDIALGSVAVLLQTDGPRPHAAPPARSARSRCACARSSACSKGRCSTTGPSRGRARRRRPG